MVDSEKPTDSSKPSPPLVWWQRPGITGWVAILGLVGSAIKWGVPYLVALLSPALVGQIIFTTYGAMLKDESRRGMTAAAYVSLQNKGDKPVVPQTYLLEIVGEDGEWQRLTVAAGQTDDFEIAFPAAEAATWGFPGSPGFVLKIPYPSMYLTTDLGRPINPGESRSGWIWFEKRGSSIADIQALKYNRGPQRLIVVDAAGTTYMMKTDLEHDLIYKDPSILFKRQPCLQLEPPPAGWKNKAADECAVASQASTPAK